MGVLVKDERESESQPLGSQGEPQQQQQQQEEEGGRILNEPSISGHHAQTNVTDKNGAHDTLANCMLDNSTERSFGVGKRSLSYEQP